MRKTLSMKRLKQFAVKFGKTLPESCDYLAVIHFLDYVDAHKND